MEDYNAFWYYTMKLNCVSTSILYTVEHSAMCPSWKIATIITIINCAFFYCYILYFLTFHSRN